jgi:mRNA interferase MazF
MIERGGIYLARRNPVRGAEPGKVRPVLVLQSDLLTQTGHETVIVLPLTTRLVEGTYPLRLRIVARGKLHKDSDLLCDQIRAIDRKRIVSEKLAELEEREMMQVETMVGLILDFET